MLERVLRYRVERPHARARLVCLPFAAGSAQTYAGLTASLPDVDVCAVDLPGHGTRFDEPLVRDAARLVTDLVDALSPLADRPLVVLGHSFGGRLGFALARGGLPVHTLVASASRPPCVRSAGHDAPLDDDSIVRRLREIGGTPAEVFNHPDLLELFVPVVRADIEVERALDSDATIDAPIVAIGSRDDKVVPYAEVERWREHTTSTFTLEAIAGTHFFVTSHAPELAAILNRCALP